jgi:putative aldouronate transport system permease protein
MKNRSFGDRIFHIFVIALSVFVMAASAYPLYFILIASFSNPSEVANGKIWLFPTGVYLDGFKRIFEHQPIWTGYRNTILYTLSYTALSLALTLPAAYALSRRELLLQKPLMTVFLVTMFFSGGLVPTYILVKNLGLIDKPLVMILPGSVNVFNLIIARTFFRNTIPDELYSAASIDGCGEFRFFASIALPLSKAIVAVLALYYAVAQWNSYFNALLYLKSKNLVPLQLALRDIMLGSGYNVRSGAGGNSASMYQQRLRELLKYCAIVVTVIPIMSVYPFLQKYFAKGVMLGAIKG